MCHKTLYVSVAAEKLMCGIKKASLCLAKMWAGWTVGHMMSCHRHRLKIIIPLQSRDSAAWLLRKRFFSQGFIFRMFKESFSWELTITVSSSSPSSFSRICLCCWTSSVPIARASAASSPARRAGWPDCRTLVTDFSHMSYVNTLFPAKGFEWMFCVCFEVGRTQFEEHLNY